ncbi:hypothetical protein NMY22_g14857 [Coprinellus aureogranulatus]|nr:hypothetical protein NMY22_g14857 [Coprinellus aureogranulatus]
MLPEKPGIGNPTPEDIPPTYDETVQAIRVLNGRLKAAVHLKPQDNLVRARRGLICPSMIILDAIKVFRLKDFTRTARVDEWLKLLEGRYRFYIRDTKAKLDLAIFSRAPFANPSPEASHDEAAIGTMGDVQEEEEENTTDAEGEIEVEGETIAETEGGGFVARPYEGGRARESHVEDNDGDDEDEGQVKGKGVQKLRRVPKARRETVAMDVDDDDDESKGGRKARTGLIEPPKELQLELQEIPCDKCANGIYYDENRTLLKQPCYKQEQKSRRTSKACWSCAYRKQGCSLAGEGDVVEQKASGSKTKKGRKGKGTGETLGEEKGNESGSGAEEVGGKSSAKQDKKKGKAERQAGRGEAKTENKKESKPPSPTRTQPRRIRPGSKPLGILRPINRRLVITQPPPRSSFPTILAL